MDDPREADGRLVREVWVEWAEEQPQPVKESWLTPWDELDDDQREVDMRIGDALTAPLRAEIARLREHIDTDHQVMTELGLLALAHSRTTAAAIEVLEAINMDTPEDRERHARYIASLKEGLAANRERLGALRERMDRA